MEHSQQHGKPGEANSLKKKGEKGVAMAADGEIPGVEELAAVKIQLQEMEDRYLRARADLDNYRKRVERERREMEAAVKAGLFLDLLPILDNFERGLAAVSDGDDRRTVGGFALIHGQLEQFLQSRGLESVAARGDPFDPHHMEAISLVSDDEVAEDAVATVVRRGYRLDQRLLRPALVTVSAGKGGGTHAPATETAENEDGREKHGG